MIRLFWRTLAAGCLVALPCAAQVDPKPPPMWTIAAAEAGTILGRNVIDSEGAEAGVLVDVLVDKAGQPVAGVINIGGFFGVGVRRVAVDWVLLHFVRDADGVRIVMDLPLDTAASGPEYPGPDDSAIVIGRPAP